MAKIKRQRFDVDPILEKISLYISDEEIKFFVSISKVSYPGARKNENECITPKDAI